MNFLTVPLSAQPVYTWLWNTAVTKEGISRQIHQMYDAGIRGFYVIGEPAYFRPLLRRTQLSPEYLSDAYLDLLYYAYEKANELGMVMWLYNEGGFPSGMVCGKIRKEHPELAMKVLETETVTLPANTPYAPSANTIAAFWNELRISEGYVSQEPRQITVYKHAGSSGVTASIRSDIASRKNTDLFLQMTHDRLQNRFGDIMGSEVTVMFDDEASMGTWTEDFESLFYDRCGYRIEDFLPCIARKKKPTTEKEYRANSDYAMTAGELIQKNYFEPMRDWLNRRGMLSAGHLDRDHDPNACFTMRYGNTMAILRSFDIPGVDAIWNQISYHPDEKELKDMMPFFPRMASSAARQQGHTRCLSESLAVYGAQVTPELMRYVVNCQAVRGISIFNFMVISYDRATPMAHQYRPNFIPENPGMTYLSQINGYTARVSHILQESTAEITTALYYPARTICAGGEIGRKAADDFTKLGVTLEQAGVSFDIIDEALVGSGTVQDGALLCVCVTYTDIFLPRSDFEKPEILQKLSKVGKQLRPCIQRTSPDILARKLRFPSGAMGYLVCNTGAQTVRDTVILSTSRKLCRIDLYDGTPHPIPQTFAEGQARISLTLLRGEGTFLMEYGEELPEEPAFETELFHLNDFSSYISRQYQIDKNEGIVNTVFPRSQVCHGLRPWDKHFSGEVTYECKIPPTGECDCILDLGEVRHIAAVYLDGNQVGELTMPPYRLSFRGRDCPRDLKIIVSNTAANACAVSDYFDSQNILDVGSYHSNMILWEEKEPGGGLLGPVRLLSANQKKQK